MRQSTVDGTLSEMVNGGTVHGRQHTFLNLKHELIFFHQSTVRQSTVHSALS